MTEQTLVLALGNPLRADDGIGLAVLDQLSRMELPQSVTLLDGGTAGLETAILLRDYQRVIIVDAAEMQLTAGSWRRFQPTALQSHSGTALAGTLHHAGLHEAILLADALGILPGEIAIYGVQPESLDWEWGLSLSVQAVIENISLSILNELYNTQGGNNG